MSKKPTKSKKSGQGKPARGRPSKYKPAFCEHLIEHMECGFSFESFAAVTRTTRETLYNWASRYPDFLHAKKMGLALSLLFWEKAGIQGLHDKGFNVGAWVFNMKNRFNWADRQEIDDGPHKRGGQYEALLERVHALELDVDPVDDDSDEGEELIYNGRGHGIRH